MKRALFLSVIVISLLAGCVPTRIVWSPDGERAVILSNEGLYLCDKQGTLSQALKSDSVKPAASPATTQPAKRIHSVEAAVWFGDSKRLVLCTKTTVRSWSDITFLSPEFQNFLIRCTQQFETQIPAGRKMEQITAELDKGLTNPEQVLYKFYLFTHLSPSVKEKILRDGHWLEESVDVRRLQIYSLENTSLKPSTLLAQTINEIHSLRLSPNGKNLAFVEKIFGTDTSSKIMLVTTGENPLLRPVDRQTNWYPDWSADSRHLIYAKSDNEPNLSLGTLLSRTICDTQGKLLPQFFSEDLAGLIYNDLLRVRCLSDGRILFSGISVTLPCTAKDMPEKMTLFAIDPSRYSRVIPIISVQVDDAVGDGLNWFEPSPDGRWVSLPGKDGTVSVMNIASGEVIRVQPIREKDDDQLQLPTVPVWRNNDELCFWTPGPKGSEIMLYSMKEKKARMISKNWPSDLLKSFHP